MDCSPQVLRVLRLGLGVLWTDVDIYWRVDPLPAILAAIESHRSERRLQSKKKDVAQLASPRSALQSSSGLTTVVASPNGDCDSVDIAIQSNAPPGEARANGYRRLNSGFYLAAAGQRTVRAFEAIVAHAASTRLSEQPSFYAVLCGEDSRYADAGGSACDNQDLPARSLVLSREMFPNGAMPAVAERVARSSLSCN